MKTIASLWVDHRKAIIMKLIDQKETVEEIFSHVERQSGRLDGERSTVSFESQLVKADDRQQRAFTKHLNSFYEKVLSSVGDAENVLVLGPGEAKNELVKLMEQQKQPKRTITIETADKMSNSEISKKTQAYISSIRIKLRSENYYRVVRTCENKTL